MKHWQYGYIIEFHDGPLEAQWLGDADTEEECEQVSRFLTAVSYSGPKRVKSAVFVWTKNSLAPESELCEK